MTTTQTSGPSARLVAKLEPLLAEVAARTGLIAGHEQPRAAYHALIRLLHSEVRASVPLLECARHAARDRAVHDPVAADLVDWLEEHAAEEAHHDEWLLDDYAVIGGHPAELLAQPGSPTIAAMVGSITTGSSTPTRWRSSAIAPFWKATRRRRRSSTRSPPAPATRPKHSTPSATTPTST